MLKDCTHIWQKSVLTCYLMLCSYWDWKRRLKYNWISLNGILAFYYYYFFSNLIQIPLRAAPLVNQALTTAYSNCLMRDDLVCFMVLNTTFNNISAILWRSVLLVEKTGVLGEIHRPVASHWQTLSHNIVSSTPCQKRGLNSQL